MFADGKLRGAQIPFYNVDVEQAIAHVTHLEAESSLVIPQAGECDLCHVLHGTCHGGRLAAGCGGLAEGRRPGCNYSRGGICDCQPKNCNFADSSLADGEDKLRLVAGDRENYDDIILNVSDISSVYKVKGKLIINS